MQIDYRRKLQVLRLRLAAVQRKEIHGADGRIIGNVGDGGAFHTAGGGGRLAESTSHQRPGTTTFYHVAHESYSNGEPLVGLYHLREEWGQDIPFKWDMPEELYGIDGHGVSLYRTLREAREHIDLFGGGHILRVHVPNDFIAGDGGARDEARLAWPYSGKRPEYSPRFDTNDEGFPFIQGFIPAEWIETVHPGDKN